MEQNPKNSGNRPSVLVRRLAAEKKKAVMALCLIAVMAFMWARVLGGKTPGKVEAASGNEQVIEEQMNSELKISFIELPNVKGRNDVLTRDFFAADGGRLGGVGKVNFVLGNGGGKVAVRIAEKLGLEAIVSGENLQAFIDDKLLSVGDKLLVRDGADVYECEVVGIEENMVFMRCGEVEITLKLVQEIEVSG